MMVMPADASGFLVGWLAARYPGRLGWLLNACCWRQNPNPLMPYGVDNGKFGAWAKKRAWDEVGFYAKLKYLRMVQHKPLWVVVPDSVGNREDTLCEWSIHAPRISQMGFRLAMAVQDGMTPDDVPENCSVIFVGGTDAWKMPSLKIWTAHFPRVHVGRINGERGLWQCHEAGAESCDGTGYFRGDKKQLSGLIHYLKESTEGRSQQLLNL